jgi:hypothetical protein
MNFWLLHIDYFVMSGGDHCLKILQNTSAATASKISSLSLSNIWRIGVSLTSLSSSLAPNDSFAADFFSKASNEFMREE